MCVLYVSFGFKVRPRTFGCVAMGSAVLFILRSRLLEYSAGSGVNRVQVVLSGFSVRLLCFAQEKTLCCHGCMYFFATLVRVCRCDGYVIYAGHDLLLLLFAFQSMFISVWVSRLEIVEFPDDVCRSVP